MHLGTLSQTDTRLVQLIFVFLFHVSHVRESQNSISFSYSGVRT
jgi:hypothetical protein